MTNCFFCGKKIHIWPSQKREKNYCDNICRGNQLALRKTGKLVKCFTCGCEIYRYPCLIKKKNFCSHSCHTKEETKKCGFKKTGIPKVNNPYRRIQVNGKRVYEHRYVMEKYLGRKLTSDEHIHHINGDPLDNTIENLLLTNNRDHHRIEYYEGKKGIKPS